MTGLTMALVIGVQSLGLTQPPQQTVPFPSDIPAEAFMFIPRYSYEVCDKYKSRGMKIKCLLAVHHMNTQLWSEDHGA